ncbi:Uncharacterised protein [Mycobacteroides abscessus]|nr:Uncharacterised protein [Mycobacteroides abscessus]
MRPWWTYTAPSCTEPSAEAASTVPSSRPVRASATRTGAPPEPRRSVMPDAGCACVQYQPDARRRRAPRATSTSSRPRTTSGVPNAARSSDRSGTSAAAAHRCGART